MKRSSFPHRFEVARWEDGYALNRLPRMESKAWFAIEHPDERPDFAMGIVVNPNPKGKHADSPQVEFNEIHRKSDSLFSRPYAISESMRRKLTWVLFDFLRVEPHKVESTSLVWPSIPVTVFDFPQTEISDLMKRYHDIDPWLDRNRNRISRRQTDALLRRLTLTYHDEQEIYPRGTDDPKYKEVRWRIELDNRPYMLVMAQRLTMDGLSSPERRPLDEVALGSDLTNPFFRLHRWDYNHNAQMGFEMAQTNLDDPGERFRLLETSSVSAWDLLQKTGLVSLDEDFDDWVDAHSDPGILRPEISTMMEAYDLLDATLDAPIFAKQMDFYVWWKTLQMEEEGP